jgi:hypothetical protein
VFSELGLKLLRWDCDFLEGSWIGFSGLHFSAARWRPARSCCDLESITSRQQNFTITTTRDFIEYLFPAPSHCRRDYSALISPVLVTHSAMADYTFGGTDEENTELKKLNAEVVSLHMSFIFFGVQG